MQYCIHNGLSEMTALLPDELMQDGSYTVLLFFQCINSDAANLW